MNGRSNGMCCGVVVLSMHRKYESNYDEEMRERWHEMVIYVATNNNHAPIENYLETWGKPVSKLIKSLRV